MKRILILLAAAAALCACSQEKKVMARFVPERSDDFVFENNLIAGRFYGKALEGNPTSPGLDIWVKLPGKLVADEWYKGFETQSDEYYHHDHGGKDCYKAMGTTTVPSSPARKAWAAWRPISKGFRARELMDGVIREVKASLAVPTMPKSSGMRRPRSRAASMAPRAEKSPAL